MKLAQKSMLILVLKYILYKFQIKNQYHRKIFLICFKSERQSKYQVYTIRLYKSQDFISITPIYISQILKYFSQIDHLQYQIPYWLSNVCIKTNSLGGINIIIETALNLVIYNSSKYWLNLKGPQILESRKLLEMKQNMGLNINRSRTKCLFCNPQNHGSCIIHSYLHKAYGASDIQIYVSNQQNHMHRFNQYVRRLFNKYEGGYDEFYVQYSYPTMKCMLTGYLDIEQTYRLATGAISKCSNISKIHIMHYYGQFYHIMRANQLDKQKTQRNRRKMLLNLHNQNKQQFLPINNNIRKQHQKLDRKNANKKRKYQNNINGSSVNLLALINNSTQQLKVLCKRIGMMCRQSVNNDNKSVNGKLKNKQREKIQNNKINRMFTQYLEKYGTRNEDQSRNKRLNNFKKSLQKNFSKIQNKQCQQLKSQLKTGCTNNQDIYGLSKKRNRSKGIKNKQKLSSNTNALLNTNNASNIQNNNTKHVIKIQQMISKKIKCSDSNSKKWMGQQNLNTNPQGSNKNLYYKQGSSTENNSKQKSSKLRKSNSSKKSGYCAEQVESTIHPKNRSCKRIHF